jgi:hypothetical protein
MKAAPARIERRKCIRAAGHDFNPLPYQRLTPQRAEKKTTPPTQRRPGSPNSKKRNTPLTERQWNSILNSHASTVLDHFGTAALTPPHATFPQAVQEPALSKPLKGGASNGCSKKNGAHTGPPGTPVVGVMARRSAFPAFRFETNEPPTSSPQKQKPRGTRGSCL